MTVDNHPIGSLPGVPPAIAMPAPILDQLEISIWKGLYQDDIILPIFEEALGKPEKTRDGKAWIWKPIGIAMSTQEKWANRIIRFSTTEEALSAIGSILKINIFPRRLNRKPAALLRSAEIAWDFPISHSYEEAESALIKLALLAIPANKRATMQCVEPYEADEEEKEGKKKYFKKCADGGTNGLITFYFQSFSRQPDKTDDDALRLLPSKNAVWRGIIYCKRLAPKEPWSIRFEATLLGQKLEKVIGKILPPDLTQLPRRLAGLCFDDFWSFERFDWSSFIEAAQRSAEYKGIPFADVEGRVKLFLSQALNRWRGLDVAILQKRNAKKFANLIGSKKLREKIGAKEFSTSMAIMDVLSKNLSSK